MGQLAGRPRPRTCARPDVLPAELVPARPGDALTYADLGRGVGDERPGERGQRLQKLGDGEGALATFLLGHGQEVAACQQLSVIRSG